LPESTGTVCALTDPQVNKTTTTPNNDSFHWIKFSPQLHIDQPKSLREFAALAAAGFPFAASRAAKRILHIYADPIRPIEYRGQSRHLRSDHRE
jgi:hypothetical protein